LEVLKDQDALNVEKIKQDRLIKSAREELKQAKQENDDVSTRQERLKEKFKQLNNDMMEVQNENHSLRHVGTGKDTALAEASRSYEILETQCSKYKLECETVRQEVQHPVPEFESNLAPNTKSQLKMQDMQQTFMETRLAVKKQEDDYSALKRTMDAANVDLLSIQEELMDNKRTSAEALASLEADKADIMKESAFKLASQEQESI